MFARYDQDLAPYFERIRGIERERRREQRRAIRQSWHALLALVGVRQKT